MRKLWPASTLRYVIYRPPNTSHDVVSQRPTAFDSSGTRPGSLQRVERPVWTSTGSRGTPSSSAAGLGSDAQRGLNGHHRGAAAARATRLSSERGAGYPRPSAGGTVDDAEQRPDRAIRRARGVMA